jgi:hypothetical protein
VRFLNGTFSLPANLGPDINTASDEDAPFIDGHSKTLYFSSKGHGSMGEYDIFKANYNNELDKWGQVSNMGQPVNSTNDDIYFVKKDNANIAYFASRREGGYGDADIYEINFSESTKVIVHCSLDIGSLQKEMLDDVQITIFEKGTEQVDGLYTPNRNYMNSILLVTKNKPYDLRVEGENIQTLEQEINFNDSKKEIVLRLKGKNE